MRLLFAILLCSAAIAHAQSTPDGQTILSASRDYSLMWWTSGFRSGDTSFSFQTSRYAACFDVPSLQLTHLAQAAATPTLRDALLTPLPQPPADASFKCSLTLAGQTFSAERASANLTECHLIEAGRFFNRRVINGIQWSPGTPKLSSILELASWPDRLALILRLTPEQAMDSAEISLQLNTTGQWTIASDRPEARIDRDPSGRTTVKLKLDRWPPGHEESVSISIRPAGVTRDDAVAITARQIDPVASSVNVVYDTTLGWHRVDLRNDNVPRDRQNDRVERVALTIANTAADPRIVRLCFAKGLPRPDGVFSITGMSAMLRDATGNPTGLPIQISKNWHNKTPGRYPGPWYRGLTAFTIPAGTTLQLEYYSVNAHYGGVAAASLAQLSLVGWGSNQLWDQAAIGSWGETLCFEPDQDQRGGAVLDSRPLMVLGMKDHQKWNWTNNVGGADFLVCYDKAGRKLAHSAMKAVHWRNGPVLTEATYAGRTQDSSIDLQYTASLHRTDDISRGLYHFRYDIRKPVDFSRLVLFQCGGDDYSYTREKKFAWGNETGLAKEWETKWGGNVYRTEPMLITGRIPWFSMHQPAWIEPGETWGCRGFVIRSWAAKLGGKPAGIHAAERGAKVRGVDVSLIDLIPPPDVKRLEPGDFVEADIEHIIVPEKATDYYGPNASLRSALDKHQNTWQMIHREALGNNLAINVTLGKLLRQRPTLIQADADRTEFTLTGGLGYVPITIANLSTYRTPLLELETSGKWTAISPWQADADGQTWQISYTVPLDTPTDHPAPRRFRFRLDK